MRVGVEKGKPVRVLVSSIRVLRYLGAAKQPVRAAHVARELGISPSTCFNILQTLLREGLVSVDRASGAYQPGLGLLALAAGAMERAGLRDAVRPHLEDLARRFSVAATLWQRLGSDRVILTDYAEGGSPVRIAMNIGQRLHLLVGALGRCMAAHAGLADDELRTLYASLRSDSPLPFDQFMEQVREVRRLGYAVDTGQFVNGVTTVSGPIRDATGAPVAAVSVVGLSAQFPDDASIQRIGEALAGVTGQINPALSGTGAVSQMR